MPWQLPGESDRTTEADSCTTALMAESIELLIDRARRVVMTDADREAQRRSFAYGNIKIENDLVTREMVEEEAAKLESLNGH
jgi:hypothetical protein